MPLLEFTSSATDIASRNSDIASSEEVMSSHQNWDQVYAEHEQPETGASASTEGLLPTYNPWSAPGGMYNPSVSQVHLHVERESNDRFNRAEQMEEGQAGASHAQPRNTGGFEGQEATRRTWGEFFADHAKFGDHFDKALKPVTVPLQVGGILTGVGYIGYRAFKGGGV